MIIEKSWNIKIKILVFCDKNFMSTAPKICQNSSSMGRSRDTAVENQETIMKKFCKVCGYFKLNNTSDTIEGNYPIVPH